MVGRVLDIGICGVMLITCFRYSLYSGLIHALPLDNSGTVARLGNRGMERSQLYITAAVG